MSAHGELDLTGKMTPALAAVELFDALLTARGHYIPTLILDNGAAIATIGPPPSRADELEAERARPVPRTNMAVAVDRDDLLTALDWLRAWARAPRRGSAAYAAVQRLAAYAGVSFP